ncbi:MAG: chemotaxis response regulator protein-glutamate methylesterase [Pseudomonadales bacterium]|nr:chemotaxis response regulator protein-glutamate methylesterase [Pseudomonadales bacterium]
MTVRVLVVDDSALMRRIIVSILEATDDLKVVGEAADPYEARDLIKALSPDVLTLDVEMPRMDGLSFLGNLMRLRPMPVIMVSTLTERGADVTLQAMALGAVDFITKPMSASADWQQVGEELCRKIRMAAGSIWHEPVRTTGQDHALSYTGHAANSIIALGASTGGTEALSVVLQRFPPEAPAVVMAQHIPPVFSTSYAHRLDRTCKIQVHEAEDGMAILPGHAYLAPGDFHLQIVGKPGAWKAKVSQFDKVNRHRPSVDVLFASLVPYASCCRAALLTGMGHDGAKGLLQLREAGAHTVIQDEATSVVWGMPGAAAALGAAVKELPLSKIAQNLLVALGR